MPFLAARDLISVRIRKLKRLKAHLKVWSKETFGDIFVSLEAMRAELGHLQRRYYNSDREEELLVRESELMRQINDMLKNEQLLLAQKSRVQWLNDGDHNTNFFHRAHKIHRCRAKISTMLINDKSCDDIRVISKHIQDFYSNLFKDSLNYSAALQFISKLLVNEVSQAQNDFLISSPTEDEVKKAIFELSSDNAPGPDGFGGIFFQVAWEKISHDIVNAVGFFFQSTLISAGLNSNDVTLIPKVIGALRVEDFCPIVLDNFLFKIMTKILSFHLGPMLNDLLSASQYGFVPSKKIHHCIAVASEGFIV